MINEPEPLASGRAAAVTGFIFSGLFIAGLLPLGELLGSFADSDQAFEVYFADSANRAGNIVGGILLAASALVFLWFLQHLRQRLQSDTTRPPTLPNFVYSTGQTFVTLLLVGTAALVTVPVTLAFATLFDDQPFTTGQAVLPQLGTVIVASSPTGPQQPWSSPPPSPPDEPACSPAGFADSATPYPPSWSSSH